MFCFCQNKRIPALCMILIGLGVILLIPKLASANNQTTLYSIDTQAHTEFFCGTCYIDSEEEVPPAVVLQNSPQALDLCDICHTDVIDSIPEDVARANEAEEQLFDASLQAVKLQQENLSERQQATIDAAVDLLAQAQENLDAGNIEAAEDLIDQANNLMTDVADDHHLGTTTSPLFMPVAFAQSSSTKSFQDVFTQNKLAMQSMDQNGQGWAINLLESHIFNQISAEAMHHRAPPADEDAMILANDINLLT